MYFSKFWLYTHVFIPLVYFVLRRTFCPEVTLAMEFYEKTCHLTKEFRCRIKIKKNQCQ
jgi:hypothetical protein